MTIKFNTQDKSFDSDYAAKAHLQTTFNKKIIDNLSKSISRWFPDSSKNPITILDLCCGHGKPTYDLMVKLNEKGIDVAKVVGYDISTAQIELAKSNYDTEPKLEFYVQNAETISDENKYDIVISLFGLHWMEDIKSTAKLIAKSLKPEGKLMFFVPLEKMDLFEIRSTFLQTSECNDFFKNFHIHPFIANYSKYVEAFDRYFDHEDNSTGEGAREMLYTENEFITFLSSWMQEIRHLKSQDACPSYVKDLVSSISPNHESNVYKTQHGNILFTEHFFSYQGSLQEDFKALDAGTINVEQAGESTGTTDEL